MACLFTQATTDAHGWPVRDPGSAGYLATFAPAAGFGTLMAAEARRRGAGHIRQLTVLGDGAAWIWNLAGGTSPRPPRSWTCPRPRTLARPRQDRRVHARNRLPRLAGRTPRRAGQRRRPRPPGRGAWPAAGQPQETRAGQGPAPLRDQRLSHALRLVPVPGLFTGSGMVEAGCKCVIGGRLKQSGMHWTEHGATGILTLRCQEASNRWNEIWNRSHNQIAEADLTSQAS